MKLTTRRFFNTQEIEILRSSLKIERKSILDSLEYEIPFESVHNKKKVQTNTNDNFLVISFSMLVIGVLFMIGSNPEVSTIFFVGGTFFLALALITKKKTVTILTYEESNIELPFTKRTKPEVVEFSSKIVEATNYFC